MKRTILLGLTGSVATVLHMKLIKALEQLGHVIILPTARAEHFLPEGFDGVKIMRDAQEWTWFRSELVKRPGFPNIDQNFDHKWRRDDQVLHIHLRDHASALVIAPCSANTLGKLANGLCDNLLTTVARAWDFNRPIVVAPAMNTQMWNHPVTSDHLDILRYWGYEIVTPQSKMLACGTEGIGALADIDEIVTCVKDALRWQLPIPVECFTGFPMSGHPGSFACQRKHEKHTGVDLYTTDGQPVSAVENGNVVGIEHFTGEWDNTPWWNNTDCILVEGATGVVCYGEVLPEESLKVGDPVMRGERIATVRRVLKENKDRPDIPGHSTSMLHMELYPHGNTKASNGFEKHLNDIMPFLLEAEDADQVKRLNYAKTN